MPRRSQRHGGSKRAGARALAFAAGLSLAGGSRAQAPGSPGPSLVREFVESVGELSRRLSPRRPELGVVVVLRGEVLALDFGAGRLSLLVDGRAERVRATPAQLAWLTPGELVELQCGDFGGERWALLSGAERGRLEGFGEAGRTRGVLSAVDKARGLLTIDGRTFHGHPLALEGLVPGQQLVVEFSRIEGRRWLSSAAPER